MIIRRFKIPKLFLNHGEAVFVKVACLEECCTTIKTKYGGAKHSKSGLGSGPWFLVPDSDFLVVEGIMKVSAAEWDHSKAFPVIWSSKRQEVYKIGMHCWFEHKLSNLCLRFGLPSRFVCCLLSPSRFFEAAWVQQVLP